MTDTTQTPEPPPHGLQDNFWRSFDVIKFLAVIVVAAWLTTIFLKLDGSTTLTNVVMIVIGYYYGSSTLKKDNLPPT